MNGLFWCVVRIGRCFLVRERLGMAFFIVYIVEIYNFYSLAQVVLCKTHKWIVDMGERGRWPLRLDLSLGEGNETGNGNY